MFPSWTVVGISGATCSGKSSLARSLYDHFTQHSADELVRNVRLIHQDDYFYKRDSSHHTWIPHMNYINREILSALDMPRMCLDVQTILNSPEDESQQQQNILIIEGFLIFNHSELWQLFDIRIHMKVSGQVCLQRRLKRQYNPPNPPGYFEQFLWPFYEKHLAEYVAAADREHIDLIELNGAEWTQSRCLAEAVAVVTNFIRLKCENNK